MPLRHDILRFAMLLPPWRHAADFRWPLLMPPLLMLSLRR